VARKLLTGCLVAAGLLVAVTVLSAVVGTVAGLLVMAFSAVGGGAVGPSEKARILAEGISAAINCTAFALLVLLPIGIAGTVWWWRRRQRRAAGAASPPSASPVPYEAPVISEEASRRYEALGFDGLTEPERVWIAVEELQMDVNNGGFDQYYFNSSGDTAWFASAALRTIGADRTATIVERANAVFGPDGPPRDREQRQEALERLRGADDDVLFKSLDDEFFKYPEDLDELLRTYLRREGFARRVLAGPDTSTAPSRSEPPGDG